MQRISAKHELQWIEQTVCVWVGCGWLAVAQNTVKKKNQITYFALLILDSSVLLPKATFEFISFSLQSTFQNHQTRLNVSKLRGLLLGAVEISVQGECVEMKKLRKFEVILCENVFAWFRFTSRNSIMAFRAQYQT